MVNVLNTEHPIGGPGAIAPIEPQDCTRAAAFQVPRGIGVTDLIVGTVSQGEIPEDQIQPEAGRGFRMDFGCINAAGRTQEMLVK